MAGRGSWQKKLLSPERRIQTLAEKNAVVAVPLVVRMVLVDVHIPLTVVAVENCVPELAELSG